jgi:isoquinoline 1-oxidoreductase alpha subunit
MASITLNINQKKHTVDVDPQTPLLWVMRDELGLTGTKYGCGIAECGSCTVHFNGTPVRSCTVPVAAAVDLEITTIEGLSEDGTHALQLAWIEEQVPQCGYCHSGQIMQAAALLQNNNKPSRDEIVEYMKGNICRCGTYLRIIKAIERASQS